MWGALPLVKKGHIQTWESNTLLHLPIGGGGAREKGEEKEEEEEARRR